MFDIVLSEDFAYQNKNSQIPDTMLGLSSRKTMVLLSMDTVDALEGKYLNL